MKIPLDIFGRYNLSGDKIMGSKFVGVIFMLVNIVFLYFVVLFLILCVLSIICSFHFLFTGARFPLPEIEDSVFFNTYFKDVASAMLYDMTRGQENIHTTLPPNQLQSKTFIDIGSGGGASIHHLQNFFGKDTNIVLSDLYPKPELWEKLKTDHVSYISVPIDATNIPLLSDCYAVSLFGSLHHMDSDTIHAFLSNIRDGRPDHTKPPISVLVVEPRRFSRFLQFLHILLLPLFFPVYFFICLTGSAMQSSILNNLVRILLVPFFMTMDHILGASRRYSYEEITEIAKENGFSAIHYSDWIFDYYIIKPI